MQTKPILAILGAGVLICGAGCFGIFRFGERFVDYRPAAAELPAAERDYRAAGLPWTAQELRPRRVDPPAAESAALIRRAGRVTEKEGWSRDDKALRGLVDADDLASAEAKLAAYAPTLALFERAAAIGRVDFGRDYDVGMNLLLPEFAFMKSGVKALGYRARVRAARGDLTGARRDLRTMRTLARMAESDGILIAMLVRISCDALADDATQRAVVRAPGLAASVLADLERPVAPPDLPRALRYEAYFLLATVRNLQGTLSPSDLKDVANGTGLRTQTDPAKLRRDGVPDELTARAYTARGLQTWTRIAGPMRTYAGDPVRLGAEIDRIVMAEDAERGMSHILNRIAFPVFAQSGLAAAKDTANRAVTLAYLRALETRRRTGSFPKVLVTGKDPYGHAYVGAREGAGFRIYSFGPNGIDDGGLTAIERAGANGLPTAKGDDVVAVYPPAKRGA